MSTAQWRIETCADVAARPAPKPVKRPLSDSAGTKTCAGLAKDYAPTKSSTLGSGLRTELIISTPNQWGAVLSVMDGAGLVAASIRQRRSDPS